MHMTMAMHNLQWHCLPPSLWADKIMNVLVYGGLPGEALGRNNLGAAGPRAENSGLTGTCGVGAAGLTAATPGLFPEVPKAPNKA